MTQKEIFDQMLKDMDHNPLATYESVQISLLTSLADSVAIIADRMQEDAEACVKRGRLEVARSIMDKIQGQTDANSAYIDTTIICKRTIDEAK